MQILFILLALLVLLIGFARYQQRKPKSPQAVRKDKNIAPSPSPAPQPSALPPEVAATDVQFRPQGARGEAGPVFGDVLCSDGVYLPQVWESDFHTSFDGRWIRIGSYGGAIPRLIDRKTQRAWTLSVPEASAVDDVHWRLPRWNGMGAAGNGVATEASGVFSDNDFENWLNKHVDQAAQPLVCVCDLWIPADIVPAEAEAVPPQIAQVEGGPVQVSLQRYWPESLRALPAPLEPLFTPYWQIFLNGEPHSWVIDAQACFVWRGDGLAFACYGFPVVQNTYQNPKRLAAWSLLGGGLQWTDTKPNDQKNWTVVPYLPDSDQAQIALQWDGQVLLQRMEIDVPQLERLHDGRLIHNGLEPVFSESARTPNGLLRTAEVALRHFYWRRDLTQPQLWQAQSEPVAGHPLVWTLAEESKPEAGSTAAYQLHWGEQALAGLWELEHVVVEGKWALLLPCANSVYAGGRTTPYAWDGKLLKAIAVPWSVVRMRAHVQSGRVQVLVLVGCGPDNSNYASTGAWRWPLQLPEPINLAKSNWSPAYEWRDLAVDAQGQWSLQPRWREVQRIQHPCADGDYVWRYRHSNDALWWWGGVHNSFNNHWALDAPRCEGIAVTKSGIAICGVGPSACPHPMGDGWLVLEWLARGSQDKDKQEKNHWKLHWLRSNKKEIRTMELRAYMPLIQTWDAAQGILWKEMADAANQHATPPEPSKEHIIPDYRWEEAYLEVLKQAAPHLWMRKQDAVYADAILLRDDCPWSA